MTLIPYINGRESTINYTKLEFDWIIDSVDEAEGIIRIKLKFMEANWISAGEMSDALKINFLSRFYFNGEENGLFLDEKYLVI